MERRNIETSSGPITTALLLYATPEVYANNAFRHTQLSIDARSSEIQRRHQIFTSAVSVGAALPSGPEPLLALAPDLETFSRAIQRLQDPPMGFCEAFFWFWPSTTPHQRAIWDALMKNESARARQLLEESIDSNPLDVASVHNLAVLLHLLALDEERVHLESFDLSGPVRWLDELWAEVFDTWRRVLHSSLLPSHVAGMIERINDPRVSLNDASQAVQRVPEILLQMSAVLAVRFANRKHLDLSSRQQDVGRQLAYMQASGFAESLQEAALRAAAQPEYDALVTLCEHCEKRADSDPASGIQILQDLITASRPQLEALDILFSAVQITRINAHDAIAKACAHCLTKYGNASSQWRDVAEAAQPLIDLALSPDLKEAIQSILDQILALLTSKDFEPDLEHIVFARDTALSLLTASPGKGLQALETFLRDLRPIIARIDQRLVTFPRIHDRLLDQIAAVGVSCIMTYGNATQHWDRAAVRVTRLVALPVSEDMRRQLSELQRSLQAIH